MIAKAPDWIKNDPIFIREMNVAMANTKNIITKVYVEKLNLIMRIDPTGSPARRFTDPKKELDEYKSWLDLAPEWLRERPEIKNLFERVRRHLLQPIVDIRNQNKKPKIDQYYQKYSDAIDQCVNSIRENNLPLNAKFPEYRTWDYLTRVVVPNTKLIEVFRDKGVELIRLALLRGYPNIVKSSPQILKNDPK